MLHHTQHKSGKDSEHVREHARLKVQNNKQCFIQVPTDAIEYLLLTCLLLKHDKAFTTLCPCSSPSAASVHFFHTQTHAIEIVYIRICGA